MLIIKGACGYYSRTIRSIDEAYEIIDEILALKIEKVKRVAVRNIFGPSYEYKLVLKEK